MKLDCVRPRHRKLSPDGRWTDMEFESAAEMEKLDLSEEGGISRKWLQTLVLVLQCSAYCQFEETAQRVKAAKQNRMRVGS